MVWCILPYRPRRPSDSHQQPTTRVISVYYALQPPYSAITFCLSLVILLCVGTKQNARTADVLPIVAINISLRTHQSREANAHAVHNTNAREPLDTLLKSTANYQALITKILVCCSSWQVSQLFMHSESIWILCLQHGLHKQEQQ